MSWLDVSLAELVRQPIISYHRGARAATEPTALAALALSRHQQSAAAREAGDWLVSCQADDGSLGVRPGEPTPRWPTSLAVLAWLAADADRFARPIVRALSWILEARGEPVRAHQTIAHDTQLLGWPWVEGTHSWVEPTALHVRALKAAGHRDHPRCREGVRLLLDRQLPTGGCNYGNTKVLGQLLRAHVQPTGLALFALQNEQAADTEGRIESSLSYLEGTLSEQTSTASLCWALLGLTAHGRPLPAAAGWLEVAAARTQQRGGSPYRMALLVLASVAEVDLGCGRESVS